MTELWTSADAGASPPETLCDESAVQGRSIVRRRWKLDEVAVEVWRLPALHALRVLVRRNDVALVFALSGAAERAGEGAMQAPTPMEVGVLARPGSASMIWRSDAEVVTIRLPRTRLQVLASASRREPTRLAANNGLAPLTPTLQLLILRLAETLGPGSPHGIVDAERIRIELEASVVDLLVGAPLAAGLLQTPRAIRQAAAIIQERVGAESDVMLPALAAAAGVTVRTLREGFRGCYGVSLSVFIQQARLTKARMALASGYDSRPMADIARTAGFGSAVAFSRAYVRAFSETPSATRVQGVRNATIDT